MHPRNRGERLWKKQSYKTRCLKAYLKRRQDDRASDFNHSRLKFSKRKDTPDGYYTSNDPTPWSIVFYLHEDWKVPKEYGYVKLSYFMNNEGKNAWGYWDKHWVKRRCSRWCRTKKRPCRWCRKGAYRRYFIEQEKVRAETGSWEGKGRGISPAPELYV